MDMEKAKQIAEELKKQLPENQEKLLRLIVVLVIAFGFFLLVNHFPQIGSVLFIILVSIALLISLAAAGFIIFKPLFFVAAELTFIIFLAQSYCDVPNPSPGSNAALQSLVAFGILYVFAHFLKSMNKLSNELLAKIKTTSLRKPPSVLVFLVLVFAGLFMVQLYQVIAPIVLNLCIYKH